jgi:hypothetical protein
MPFDLFAHAGKWANNLANKSKLGYVLTNPLWASVIIVAVVLLTVYWVGWTGSPSFKLIFYLFGVFIIFLVVHDGLLVEQVKENVESFNGASVVDDLNQNPVTAVAPRPAEEATQSFMKQVESQPLDADDLLKAIN